MGERLALGPSFRKGGRISVKGPIPGPMPVPFLATNPRMPLTGMRATALFRDTGQVGSLAGAAYLLHNNAGVLSEAQCEQKSRVEHKGKSLVDSRPSVLVRTVKRHSNPAQYERNRRIGYLVMRSPEKAVAQSYHP